MSNQDILILKAQEVRSILTGRELEIIQTVSEAYRSHTRAEGSPSRFHQVHSWRNYQRSGAARTGNSAAVFSPFGLGILDVALAKTVRDIGLQQGKGTVIESFLPDSWKAEAQQ